MQQKLVDLYKYFGLDRPQGGAGYLSCYIQQTMAAISPGRLRPAALIIPGGGYGHVSAREGEPVALRFLAKGYSTFVLEYSVAPAKYPVQLQEAAMAMAYTYYLADSPEDSRVRTEKSPVWQRTAS